VLPPIRDPGEVEFDNQLELPVYVTHMLYCTYVPTWENFDLRQSFQNVTIFT